MKVTSKLTLYRLPKISLNKFYAGMHWTKRKKIKDQYEKIIYSQIKHIFCKENTYECEYRFYFNKKPLDVSNCVGMLKLIEDCLFQTDSYKVVKKLTILSLKDSKERVEIKVKRL